MLEVLNVSKYYGGLPAVRGVSFAARRGEVLGYLGPNGSGKSTTVNMIAGLLDPTSGRIRVDGEDIHRDLLAHRRRIGYVPETPDVYSYLTGPEYLTLVGRLRRIAPDVLEEKIERFLRLFGIYGDRYVQLSGYSKGMRQKILIAAGLLHDPEIVILDEPSSGLDVGTTLVLKQLTSPAATCRSSRSSVTPPPTSRRRCRPACSCSSPSSRCRRDSPSRVRDASTSG